MAVLGLRFCARAFSSCGERGPLLIAVRGPLTIAASLVAEHRLQTRRLSSCGSRAQLLRGMWDLPRPGLEPVSPPLAGRFSTTAPPGKPPMPSYTHLPQPNRSKESSQPIPKAQQARNSLSSLKLGPVLTPRPWSAAHKLCLSTGCVPEAGQGTKQSSVLRSVPEVTRRASNPHPSLDRGGNWSSERERGLPEVTQQDNSEPALEPQPPTSGTQNSGHTSQPLVGHAG